MSILTTYLLICVLLGFCVFSCVYLGLLLQEKNEADRKRNKETNEYFENIINNLHAQQVNATLDLINAKPQAEKEL